jgi:hypothetical protein
MAFGGESRDSGLAKTIATAFEGFGLLNKGSASAPAAPATGLSGAVEAISTNSLNVTRVGGVGALISGAGAAAIGIFSVDKAKDPVAVVVAAYASVGIIVAAATLTVAIIIAADIRARSAIAVAVAAGPNPQPAATVKSISGSGTTNAALSRAFEQVLVDAGDGDVAVTLPSAASSEWQSVTLTRTDAISGHMVTVFPVAGFADEKLDVTPAAPSATLYSTGKSWERLMPGGA